MKIARSAAAPIAAGMAAALLGMAAAQAQSTPPSCPVVDSTGRTDCSSDSGGGVNPYWLRDAIKSLFPSEEDRRNSAQWAAHDLNEEANRAYGNGDFSRAISLYEKALQRWPENAQIAKNLQAARDADRAKREDQVRRRAEENHRVAMQRSLDGLSRVLGETSADFDRGRRSVQVPVNSDLEFLMPSTAPTTRELELLYPGLAPQRPTAADASPQITPNRTPASTELSFFPAAPEPARRPPHTDTAVVDARVVQQGAELIAQVPELAQSPAADRIRKGYQGVINHDWPVALVWWKEALQRDPNNKTLQESVKLAQWMVDWRKDPANLARTSKPVPRWVEAIDRGEVNKVLRGEIPLD
jgi:tetratricopeptide (TPR) repeat protein